MKAAVIHLVTQPAQRKQAPLRVREMSRTEAAEKFELNPRIDVTHPASRHASAIANIILLLVRARDPTSTNARQAA